MQLTNPHQLLGHPHALIADECRRLVFGAPFGQHNNDAIHSYFDAQFLGLRRTHEPPLHLLPVEQ